MKESRPRLLSYKQIVKFSQIDIFWNAQILNFYGLHSTVFAETLTICIGENDILVTTLTYATAHILVSGDMDRSKLNLFWKENTTRKEDFRGPFELFTNGSREA